MSVPPKVFISRWFFAHRPTLCSPNLVPWVAGVGVGVGVGFGCCRALVFSIPCFRPYTGHHVTLGVQVFSR